jgi:hypothetical protein
LNPGWYQHRNQSPEPRKRINKSHQQDHSRENPVIGKKHLGIAVQDSPEKQLEVIIFCQPGYFVPYRFQRFMLLFFLPKGRGVFIIEGSL